MDNGTGAKNLKELLVDVGGAQGVESPGLGDRPPRTLIRVRKQKKHNPEPFDAMREKQDAAVEKLEAAEGEEKVVVEKFIQKTSLEAVREMKKQLLFNPDPRQRQDAARYFLDASGHGRKEAQLGSGGSIIVIAGIQQGQLPWQKTIEGQATVVTAAPAKEVASGAAISANEAGPVQS